MGAADQTVLGPPQPSAPAWAQVPMAAPTLLDSQPPFRAVTPAGGHPALPARPDPRPPTATAQPAPTQAASETTPSASPKVRGPQTIAAAHMHRALDATRADVADRRRGRQRAGLALVLGLGVLIAGLVLYATRFRAELVDTFEVTRTSSGYAVKAGLLTSGPAIARHPGGQTPVDGSAELRFELPAASLHLGDNPIEVHVDGQGSTRTLTLHVMVYYHRVAPPPAPPKRGTWVHLGLEVLPGWTASLKTPGTVTLVDATHLRLSVDPGPAIDATPPGSTVMVPIAFDLRAPDGMTHAFTERLHLPAPAAPPR